MSIRQRAELAASEVAQGRSGVRFDISPDNRYGYAAGTGLRLWERNSGDWGKPRKALAEVYREMPEAPGE
ncbi:MAG: hypothetical protein HFH91_13345 [Lachnospiraceae bacterium]|nr:hypothetical protein [Lachnospiraceae bacterium]